MSNDPIDTKRWVTNINRDPKKIQEEFDNNSGSYDLEMTKRGYNAPTTGVQLFAKVVSRKDCLVLDAGCGTGMVGFELSKYGFSNIAGMDISLKSLEVAKSKNVYRIIRQQNLLEPFPFEDKTFDGLICIGVLSRFEPEKIIDVLGEFARLLTDDGVCVFSHREDLIQTTNFIKIAKSLKSHGLILQHVTDPKDYFTNDPNYADKSVRFFLFKKAKT